MEGLDDLQEHEQTHATLLAQTDRLARLESVR